ncbi:MAG TPA: PLP-dependent aminotransferase family protein, partial [Solirubrobacteraceae bacterium]
MSPGGLERDPDAVSGGRDPHPPVRDPDHTAPRRRSSARDIQRYAALFAQRTKVMRSSAMRDLMALTEREDVISLAGGLPDTSTF